MTTTRCIVHRFSVVGADGLCVMCEGERARARDVRGFHQLGKPVVRTMLQMHVDDSRWLRESAPEREPTVGYSEASRRNFNGRVDPVF